MAAPKRIVLGSGKLYVSALSNDTMPDTSTLCVDANQLGYIQGGATLTYTPTFYTAKDDLGVCTKSVLTEEDVTLACGVMTFTGSTLDKLVATGTVTEDATNHTRTLKIGGVGQNDGAAYAICFKHEDAVDGDIYVLIKGKNESGFTMSFAKDQETVINAEFHALSQDSNGTLIQYIEETE